MAVIDNDSEKEVNVVNDCEPVKISVILNNYNNTTVHHRSTCYTTEVFVKGINFLLNKRIKKDPSYNNQDKKFLNLISIDDGFQDGSPSSTDLSVWNEFDHGAWSDGKKELQCLVEPNQKINEEICSVKSPCLKKLKEDADYNKYQLLPKFNDNFYKSFEHLVQDFEAKFNSESSSALRLSAIDMTKLDIAQTQYELHNIFQSIFSDNIDWGRIVAMIGFVCELSWYAFVNRRPELITEYIIISVEFVHRNLWKWISQHGGWEGMVEFELGQNSGNELENIFNGLTRIGRVAILALAGMAFCKYISDHI